MSEHNKGRWDSIRVAREAIERYPKQYHGPMRRITFGENTTFRVRSPEGTFALRLYRPNRWTPDAITVEHEFMQFLGDTLNVFPPIPGLDGQTLQRTERGVCAALFRWVPGRIVNRALKPDHVRKIGAFLARLHERGRFFSDSHMRVIWDQDELLERSLEIIEEVWDDLFPDMPYDWAGRVDQLEDLWDAASPEEGFLHGDIHATNLKFHQGKIYPIDFDDFGFGPLAYELGVIGYNNIDSPELFEPLIEGYNEFASSPMTLDDLYLFTGVRVVFLMAWVLERMDSFDDEDLQDSAQTNIERMDIVTRYLGLS